MRKNILALSIATMIGGLGMANAAVFDPATTQVVGTNAAVTFLQPAGVLPATQLQVSPGGIGHSLITPYYTVQGGNMTVVSIVNTDPTNGKAVKVRFRGGSNSDDVLDFQVFMSPNDHWSAAISKNAVTGYAMLTTADRSCTVPPIPAAGQTFTAGRLPAYATATDLANMTSEGYVEIFNMADIPPTAASVTTTLFQSILHTAGVPRNCAATAVQTAPLTDAASVAAAAGLGFSAPTTGLFGNWTVINVAQTTTYSGEMTAVAAVTAGGVPGYGNYVYSPQSAAPVGATIDTLTADPLLRTLGNAFTAMDAGGNGGTTGNVAQAIPAAFYDLPDMSTPYIPTGAALAVTSPLGQAFNMTTALAVTSLSNEYTNEASLTASTDWTFSMPTRRYSVGVVYGATAATNARRFSSVAGSNGLASLNAAIVVADPIRTQYFYTGNTSLTAGGLICVNSAGQTFFDREETGSVSSAAVFSPNNVTVFQFCGETSVTSFSQSSASTLGSLLNPVSVNAMANGWARIVTTTATNNAASANGGNASNVLGTIGLPITGAAFLKLNNPAASAGKAGTYGLTFNHRYTR